MASGSGKRLLGFVVVGHINGRLAMRTCKCKQCGDDFTEYDSNPAVHYSQLEELCIVCKRYNSAEIGAWLQKSDGSYYQKEETDNEETDNEETDNEETDNEVDQ